MISPLANVSPNAKIGKDVTIMPFAYIEDNVEIGDGCVIMPYVSIMSGTVLGKNNKVHQHAVLGSEPQDFRYRGEPSGLVIGDNNSIRENVVIARSSRGGQSSRIGNGNFLMDKVHFCHDVHLGDNCIVGIGTSVAGDCTIDSCTILSTSVVLNQSVHVGQWVLVQGGCRVSKDVPPYIIVAGNPPMYHGVNATVMTHSNVLKISDRILRHIISAYRLLSQAQFSLTDAIQKIKDQVPKSEEIYEILRFVENSKNGIVR